MKKLFTFCLLAVMSITAWAHDFAVVVTPGTKDSIYYNILADSVSVEVTYEAGVYSLFPDRYKGAVTIPSYVTYTDPTTNVTKTYKVRAIGGQAFEECANLTSVTLPETIDSICSEAFRTCTGLTSLPDISHVDSIPDFTFEECSSITSIEIPANVRYIGHAAFGTSTGLTSLTVAVGNPVYSSPFLDEEKTKPSNCVMLTAAKALVVACNLTKVIPEGTKAIYGSAYFGCNAIDTIIMPNSVDSVGGSVFQDCLSLKKITLSGGLKVLGKSMFNGCAALESITLNEGITGILGSAFQDCAALKEIYLPSTIDTLGFTSFGGCVALEKIVVATANPKYMSSVNGVESNCVIEKATNFLIIGCKTTKIPSSVEGIAGGAFESCEQLESIDIPEGVKFIGEAAFQDCPLMTQVTLPAGLDSIGASAFKACIGLTTINIPNSVKKIADKTFWRCSALPSITLPEGIDSIGAEAFRMCGALTTINFPEGLKVIGETAFERCYALPSVALPASLDSLGNYAFDSCHVLTRVAFKSIPYVGANSMDTTVVKTRTLDLADGAYVYTGTNSFPVLSTPATYTRQLASGQQWGTLVLPFATVNREKYKLYKLSKAEKEALTFTSYNDGDTIAANTPVVFKAAEAGANVVFTASNDSVSASTTFINSSEYSGWTMTGTYEAVRKNSTAGGTQIYYIGTNNQFYYANMEFPVSGFRGWFETPTKVSAKAMSIRVMDFGATGISELKSDSKKCTDSFYNLAGQKVSSGTKGMVIINSKKVLIK